MVTPPKIRTGFFIIADISGYTSFLTETELEHAQGIIEEIIRLLLDHIQPPLKIVQLEGDAVFYYVPEEMLPEPERLLEHITDHGSGSLISWIASRRGPRAIG